MIKLIVKEKKTQEEVMRVDYFVNIDIDYKIAALYAMNCISHIEAGDVSDLMGFVISLREDALNGTLHEVEKATLEKFEVMFDISFEDVGEKIQEATDVSDLFK